MKKNLFAFATTVVAVFASVASAQPVRMNMNVPVAFRTANAEMTQGAYQVLISSMAGGAPMVTFRNEETGKVAAAGAMRLQSSAKAGHAVVRLGCIRKSCYLESISRGTTEYSFTTRRLTPEERQQLYAVIIPIDSLPSRDR